jgi:hypothetical protein
MERLIRLGLISRLKQQLFGNDEASPTLPEPPRLDVTGDEAVRRFAETCRARGLPTYEADGLTVWRRTPPL